MASWCYREIIHTRLVPRGRPQRPERRQLAIKEIHGKGRRGGGLIKPPDCNCPKVLASLVNVPTDRGPASATRQAFSLLGPCRVMFF